MPELPEVETIKLGLQKRIVGLKITKIQINSAKSFQNSKGQPFDSAQGLQGRKVLKVWRKAKILGIDLSSSLRDHEVAKQSSKLGRSSRPRLQRVLRMTEGVTLLIHLKMSGQLIYEDGSRFIGGHPTPDMKGDMPNSHTRVIFSFSDGSKLYFNDQRRFGWIKAIDNGQRPPKGAIDNSLKNLGPEPLEKEFTWQILKQNLLRHKSHPVKIALMDQSVIAGVGNIYANEACFDAKINPGRKVSELNDEQFKSLYKGIIKSLKDGIKYGGSSRAHFVDAEGHKGYFLDYAYVYGRTSYPCKKCETEIQKIQLGGRGTYFCPNCQT